MSFISHNPQKYRGQAVGSGQCVAYVQYAAGCPHTSHWRRGRKVRASDDIEPGTAIACFDPNGRYGNHTDGRSHAAIFVEETGAGLVVFDQWRGQSVHQRTIRFRGGKGKRVNDGDAFCVIEVEEPI